VPLRVRIEFIFVSGNISLFCTSLYEKACDEPGIAKVHSRTTFGGIALMRRTLSLICILALSRASWGQSNQASWANLNALRTGQKIQIVDMKSKKHSGTFVSVSDTAISYRDVAGEESIQKPDVRSVKASKHHRVLNAVVGGVIGGGVGAGIFYGAWEDRGYLGGKGTGAEIGALIGGVLGVTVGVLMPTNTTIYRVNSR
jgi:hypothetical protein